MPGNQKPQNQPRNNNSWNRNVKKISKQGRKPEINSLYCVSKEMEKDFNKIQRNNKRQYPSSSHHS